MLTNSLQFLKAPLPIKVREETSEKSGFFRVLHSANASAPMTFKVFFVFSLISIVVRLWHP